MIINGSNDGAWISYTSDGESTQSAGLNVLPWDLLVLNVRRNFLFPHTILPEFGEFAEFCFGEIDGNCNIVDGNIDNRNQKISLRLITCDMPAKHVLLRESECWGERKLLVTAPKWATQVAANRSRH